MLEWQDYIERLLSHESSFDGISLSYDNDCQSIGVPPIIKTSVLMLDRMQACQGNFNILVFPERIQSIFTFTLVKLLYNILEGRIDRAYDPEAFRAGEKLRFGKAVVEFIRVEERDDKKCMKLRLADLETSAPIAFFPMFQKTNAQKLSKYLRFVEAKRDAAKQIAHMAPEMKYLRILADYKTHMDSSIVNMTSIISAKELFASCKLCGQDVKDIILVGQMDYEGKVRNIGPGQLNGTPAIVLASDLYAIAAAARSGHPIQSIIIDGSNANNLLSQMDALDELMRLGVPVTCATDIVNSFDLQPFLDRQFNIWRWDAQSITSKLYGVSQLISDKKIHHCATREVEYLVSAGNEISIAIRKLSLQRSEVQTLSAQMLKVFDTLYRLTFTALRETVPFSEAQIDPIRRILDECYIVLGEEKAYLSTGTYEDFSLVIDCLRKVYSKGYFLPKHEALSERLRKEKYHSICIVVPEQSDKHHVQEYWQAWCSSSAVSTQVQVLYPAEYYPVHCAQFSATIVVGWLKRAIMRKILYSFNTQTYTILLYDYEKRWKNYDTTKWNAALDSHRNRETIEKSFATDTLPVSTARFEPAPIETIETPETDEHTEIEIILRENKYRQYVAGGGQKTATETVEAIPVNFVGGYIAFYRTGHRVLSATNIIVNDADRIREEDKVFPVNLKLGDFVVVRDTDRDLIKEMADVILEQSGKAELRQLASKWKEALEIEQLFYSPDEIYEHLQAAGCTRGYPTVRSWLFEDDIIAPQSKDDLKIIAKVTQSGVLEELLDQVDAAAQSVRIAHVQAGRLLSQQLRNRIVEALNNYGSIDSFNIWEPIELQVEGVGLVRVLKIIDIGSPVMVDITNTNRLIDDE